MISKYDFLKKLSSTKSLLDLLMACEDYLDSLDIYGFKNWFDGEIVQGPIVKKYWVSLILKYDYIKMPDPQGGLRLLKYGCLVKYMKAQQKEIISKMDNNTINTQTDPSKKNVGVKDIWLVYIQIPRKFVEDEINNKSEYDAMKTELPTPDDKPSEEPPEPSMDEENEEPISDL